ncbi:uncharacterized protein LOC135488997 isoform X2 [Lineus longissimus]|uniref:uncharacterized protein LOC135488997 isoform X2 n=1 Tax=Lineus longissimus TaxID=88925 RepID=UPI00315D49B9
MSQNGFDDHDAILSFEEDYSNKIHFYISEEDLDDDLGRSHGSSVTKIRNDSNISETIHETAIKEETQLTVSEAPDLALGVVEGSNGGLDGGRGAVHRMPSPAQERRLVPKTSSPLAGGKSPIELGTPASPSNVQATSERKWPERCVSAGSRDHKPQASPTSPSVPLYSPKAHSTPHDDLTRKRSVSPAVTPRIRLSSPPEPFRGSASVSETSSHTILDEFLLESQSKSATIPREQSKALSTITKPKPKPHSMSSSMAKTYNYSVGLDHLDNLCRLIEQLASLKEENSKFKKKCAYLEDTKDILKIQNIMLQRQVEEQNRELERSSSDTTLQKNKSESALADVRKDYDNLYDDDVFSKSGSVTPKLRHRGLKPRSQSVGSVDFAEQIINKSVDSHGAILASVVAPSKNSHDKFKKSFKFTRWETVKRVFGKGKKEDGVTTENFGSVIRSKVPTFHLLDLRPKGHQGPDRPLRRSVSSIEPSSPSPSSSHSEPPHASHDDDLTSEVWMGPADKRGDTSPGYMSDGNLELLVIDLDASKRGHIVGPHGQRLERRKSSPTLSVNKSSDDEGEEIKRPTTPVLGRSGSFRRHEYKSQSQELQDRNERRGEPDSKIKSRTAWGKVKEYIHTRKDSLKKRPSRGRKHQDVENRKSMTDAIFRSGENLTGNGENLSRSLEASMDSTGQYPSPSQTRPKPALEPALSSGMTASRTVDLTALLGGMSEEYTKKMREWEEKKTSTRTTLLSHRSDSGSIPDNLGTVASSSEPNLSEEFVHSEEWEGLKSSHTAIELTSKSKSEATSTDSTPRESTVAPPSSLDELTRSMSDSFNRKMQEWERKRHGGGGSGGSGGGGTGGGGGGGGGSSGSSLATSMELAGPPDKKSAWNWQKSEKKKDKHDKEKLRLDRMREKELQKVEREQQKLEKEKHRLERERQRTFKREVELERKKEQLEDFGWDLHHLHRDHPLHLFSEEGKYKYVNVGEYAVEGISEEFAKRLQEWEIRKGQKKEHQPLSSNDAQHLLTEDLQAMTRADAVNIPPHISRQSEGNIILPPQFKEGHVPLPIVIRTHHGIPEQIGSIQPLPQTVRVDPTYQKAHQTVHETQTTPRKTMDQGTSPESTVFTYPTVIEMQESNVHLRQQLRQKESDYRNLQDDLEGLNRALRRMNESYTKEIASYKRQLWASSNWGQVTNQSKFIADAVTELRKRVDQLEEVYQHRDIPTSQTGQTGKFKDVGPDPSLSGVNPALIEYLTKLFAQIQDLRQGIIERNQLIEDVKKHLAMQEVTNLLLNADIQRRDIELQLYRKRHRHGTRRHCTFGGRDFCMREGCQDQHSSPTLQQSPRCSNAAHIRERLRNIQHGHFDPAAVMEPDIPDILRNCGICSEPATSVKRDDVHLTPVGSPMSSRSPSVSRPESPRPPTGRRGIRIPVKGGENKEIQISVKCTSSPRRKLARQHERASFDSSLISSGNGYPNLVTSKNVPSPDLSSSRKAASSDARLKYLTSVSVQAVPLPPEYSKLSNQTVVDLGAGSRARPLSDQVPKRSGDAKDSFQKTSTPKGVPHKYERSATSPLYPVEGDDDSETRTRCSSISSGSDISSDRSFKIRSATYFSPKPYGRCNTVEGDSDRSPQQRQIQRMTFQYPATSPISGPNTRQVGPLRKLRSASDVLHDRPGQDYIGHDQREKMYKEREDVSEEVEKVARSFRLESSQDGKESPSHGQKLTLEDV